MTNHLWREIDPASFRAARLEIGGHLPGTAAETADRRIAAGLLDQPVEHFSVEWLVIELAAEVGRVVFGDKIVTGLDVADRQAANDSG